MREVFISETIRKMILVDTIDKAKNFVTLANTCPCEMDIISGRHNVNAKSILGLFSLNLEKTVELRIYDKDKASEALEILKDFITDEEPIAIEDPYAKAIIL